MEEQRGISIFICGKCGEDTRETENDIRKVILSGWANMLCDVCRKCFEDEVEKIAKKYLK